MVDELADRREEQRATAVAGARSPRSSRAARSRRPPGTRAGPWARSAMGRPNHVVRVHGMFCHTASTNAVSRSSGTGSARSGGPSPSTRCAGNARAVRRRDFVRRTDGRRHPAHVVKWLAGPCERPAAMLRVVLAVAEHPRAALDRIGLVGGGAAVELVERALADDGRDADAGRRPEALVELEVGVAAARPR